MNYAIIFKLLSVILAAIGLAFAMSMGVGFYYDRWVSGHDERLAIIGFAASLVAALGLALGFFVLGREGSNKMFRKEGLAVIGLGWLLASLAGALPYYLILPGCGLADAVFESASGFTTTGASVFSDLDKMPRSLMFWRCISQWIGGLGVVVFFVAILAFLGAGAKILFSRESSAESADLKSARVQTGIYRIVYYYLGLSVFCAAVYRLCGLNWYEAVCHMFTTLSTGGFSTRGASIAAFQNPAFEWCVILFMALSGASFLFMLQVLAREWAEARRNTEVPGYFAFLAGGAAAIAGLLFYAFPGGGIRETARAAVFQAVSIMTTTGYCTADFDLWPPAAHVLLLLLMMTGGCSGSTGGGLKVIRILVGLRVCRFHIERSFRARVVRSLKINGQPLREEDQENVVIYLVLIGLIIAAGTLLAALFEPRMSFPGTFSAVIASLFNIGPGLAEVGPARNYAGLHDCTKIGLSLLMIMGRLELYAILALFWPSLWRRFT